ncbi:uncharacterized protein LOC114188764 [Vigna unguiculata]|uniref:uncharacterized protein LOC114172658 n=1 Tax=Vigna unguiculata TaxID=3917 RepID=UPI0010161427|nr:uncharacterized protein LOC114172658 [Vigna unguiculata]XP_027933204.1 uncharacterized protein LOC114188764 [Vigna unguiculata]
MAERNDIQMQIVALSQHLERLMKQQQDEFHDRLDQLENRTPPRGGGGGPQRNEGRIEGVRLNVTPFKGRSDPEAYLEWELKIEHVFSCNNYSEEQKVRLAATEFSDYALIWWNKLQRQRIRDEEPLVDTLDEMKRVKRKWYVPSSFHRDLKLKLQRHSQGSKGVDEYYKEMEILIIQAKIEEDPEVTMARFLNGLNHDIRDVIELQEFVEMKDLLHKAIQVEQQIKRKSTTRKSSTNFNSSNYRDKVKKEGVTSSSNSVLSNERKIVQKKVEHPPKRTREVKGFKCLGMGHYAYECPTKKTVLLKENWEYTSDSDDNDGEVEESDGELKANVGELYMIRRIMGSQVKDEDASQRENNFHTRCSVNGNVCLVIINGGSCTNVVSSRLVSKMNTKPHPRPYKLQWLSEGEEVQVKKQAKVSFSIGKYQDKILCDVVPMEASHILLGRPWRYDIKAIHDGFTNKISFMYQDKKWSSNPYLLKRCVRIK